MVLGGAGAWPPAGQACSGYLVEHGGFRLLVDPGCAVLPRLLEVVPAGAVDAVLVSHGHPDHCADLHPLLRARVFTGDQPVPLPVHAPPGACDAVLALDPAGSLASGYRLAEFEPGGAGWEIGPFRVDTWLLPHHLPNAGLRLSAAGRVLAYTGDSGPSPDIVALARDADLFLAEATHPVEVPGGNARYLSTARQAGAVAAAAGAGRLLLTHLWPGTDPEVAGTEAGRSYRGPLGVASPGTVVAL